MSLNSLSKGENVTSTLSLSSGEEVKQKLPLITYIFGSYIKNIYNTLVLIIGIMIFGLTHITIFLSLKHKVESFFLRSLESLYFQSKRFFQLFCHEVQEWPIGFFFLRLP